MTTAQQTNYQASQLLFTSIHRYIRNGSIPKRPDQNCP